MNESPYIRYGRLLESAEISGYAAHRAFEVTRELLESGGWKQVGSGFDDASVFIRSVPFGTLNPPEELRKTYEKLAFDHGASKRAIADSAGVDEKTIRNDLRSDADDSALDHEDDASDLHEHESERGVGADNSAPTEGASPEIFEDAETDELEPSPTPTKPEPQPEPEPELETEPPTQPEPSKPAPVMLTLRTHKGDEVPYPKPASKSTFNETTGEGISWASWSWNPVTGCLHGCDYCYARAIAHRFTDAYPVGFTPLFHHERLDAPVNTSIPAAHRGDPAYKRVFVCSMADLYGRWVPDEWIEQVHGSMIASPWWQYILLTKFPARYVGLDLPPKAWVGTSVDEQKRVRIAEDAFRQLDGVAVKWLSLEPLLEPLEFTDLSVFDWVVIGAQTETRQPDGTVEAFDPPPQWVIRISAQAIEAGCKVHWKPNLRRSLWLDEYPEVE